MLASAVRRSVVNCIVISPLRLRLPDHRSWYDLFCTLHCACRLRSDLPSQRASPVLRTNRLRPLQEHHGEACRQNWQDASRRHDCLPWIALGFPAFARTWPKLPIIIERTVPYIQRRSCYHHACNLSCPMRSECRLAKSPTPGPRRLTNRAGPSGLIRGYHYHAAISRVNPERGRSINRGMGLRTVKRVGVGHDTLRHGHGDTPARYPRGRLGTPHVRAASSNCAFCDSRGEESAIR
jgi:hypothetical protein